ncbi:MAG: hypothetical protein Tsb0015_10930 [Simkaniaceae bacterium]
MHVVRILAWIFLAAYLIFSGLTTMTGPMPYMVQNFMGLVAAASGVLILISLGHREE